MALFMGLLMKEGAKDSAISTAHTAHSPKSMYEYSAYMVSKLSCAGVGGWRVVGALQSSPWGTQVTGVLHLNVWDMNG